MDYLEFILEQAIDGDGPPLTDHGPAATNREQAERRFTRRDGYREFVMIDAEVYLADLDTD